MGWGAKSLVDIPKGGFVCEYVGELISGKPLPPWRINAALVCEGVFLFFLVVNRSQITIFLGYFLDLKSMLSAVCPKK